MWPARHFLQATLHFSASEWKFFGPSFWLSADFTVHTRTFCDQVALARKMMTPARAGHLLHVLTGSHRCPECRINETHADILADSPLAKATRIEHKQTLALGKLISAA